MALAGLRVGVIGGVAIMSRPAGPSLAAVSSAIPSLGLGQKFAVGGMVRRACFIDGDIIWLESAKIKIADIGTPDNPEPPCASEYDRRIEA